MHILDEIIAHKEKEVAENKSLFPTKLLERSIYFDGQTVSLKKYLQKDDKSGIIAEIKRASPSKGIINAHVDVERTSIGYMQAGASALSILTDNNFFSGSSEDLKTARRFNFCPILRKDFIIDEYQIVEAKSIGADAVLLIAATLKPGKLKKLAKFAKSIGLEVLMEVHNGDELANNLHEEVDLIGVNNRDLKTFDVSIQTSIDLVESIPSNYVKVSESGISNVESILKLKECGFSGFLIGEYFMGHSLPERACSVLVNQLNQHSDAINA